MATSAPFPAPIAIGSLRRGGRALKWLQPSITPVPADVPKAVILLTRNPVEQAKSWNKLAHAGIVYDPSGRGKPVRPGAINVESVRLSEAACVAALRGSVRWSTTFEKIIAQPLRTSATIAAFIHTLGGPSLNVEAMASIVLPRGPECAPDLAIEAAGWDAFLEASDVSGSNDPTADGCGVAS